MSRSVFLVYAHATNPFCEYFESGLKKLTRQTRG